MAQSSLAIRRSAFHAARPRASRCGRYVCALMLVLSLAPGVLGAAEGTATFADRRAERLRSIPTPPMPFPKDVDAAEAIDHLIVASWSELPAEERPKALCDDATFARRVYLDLIGIIPSLAELNHFLSDSSPQKREKLIDGLLARNDEYAAHWAPFWEDALASQTVLAQGGVPTRGNYRQWLLDSFAANKPYDLLVAELLDPAMPGHRPAETQDIFGTKLDIEFVRNEDPTVTLQTAAAVGQVFLSTSMKCASCHDHFDNPEWPQERFLGFAGLFAPADLEKVRCDVHSGVRVPARFPFNVAGAPTEVPDDLAGRLHLVAQLITDPANERFSKTIVNRLWRRYLGTGLFEPADDYRDDHPVSHPALLNWLAYDFMAHGYDLKHTIRRIVTSRTYQFSYEPRWADQPATASSTTDRKPRYFRSPALRRLTAEQTIDSSRMATTGKVAAGERAFLDARITSLARVLGKPASRTEICTTRPDDVAVVQSLELLNGPEIHELIDGSPLFAKPLKKQDWRRLVDRLYRQVLSRPATAQEKRLGMTLLTSLAEPAEGVKDIYWALLVSPEFQYIK